MIFILYCIILAIGVYVAPGLALFPRLAFHPRLFALTPVVSAVLVYFIVTILLACHLYQRNIVIGISVFLTLMAIVRVKKQYQSCMLHYWSLAAKGYYFFHALLLLPFFIKLAMHGFERGDEIYSWNFWAIQHYLSLPIDFSHTGAPYPQLLPKWLSYCYQILGNIELQLPIKALLILFPYMMLNIIASLLSFHHRRVVIFYVLGLIFVLFGCRIAQFFDNGYADPLMSASLIISAVCYWQYHRWMQIRQNRITSLKRIDFIALSYLLFSYLSALAAFLAKQPGLLWVGVLVILTLYHTLIQRPKTGSSIGVPLLLIGLILGLVYVWLKTEGQHFQDNGGVIGLSKGERSLFEQLTLSVYRYLVLKPALLFLFVGSFWVSQKEKLLRKFFWMFFLPGVFLWFVFGAYQLRLGQHLIAFAWFIVIASCLRGKALLFWRGEEKVIPHWMRDSNVLNYPKTLISLLFILSVSISVFLWYKACYIERKNVSVYQGRRVALNRYFGADSDWIYQNIYKNDRLLLWVPSRYLYGLFYPNTQLTTPDYKEYPHYDKLALIDELLRKKPDYVFVTSNAIADGLASTLLIELVQQYPDVFEVVAQAPNRFNFVTYRFYHDKLFEHFAEETA